MTESTAVRFWEKVKCGESNECWEWQACINRLGYGRFGTGQEVKGAHVISWELHFGPVPAGEQVCHSCNKRHCVNPSHLYLKGNLETRFWRKVKIQESHECWEWQASTRNHGSPYGSFHTGKKSKQAHRLAWELTYGFIPSHLCVCHHCDNPLCCNPSHLFLGTSADNSHDRDAKGRQRTPLGAAHGMAKLNQEQVLEIRRLYRAGGISQLKLGEMFSVSERQVGRIIHRTSWKHV